MLGNEGMLDPVLGIETSGMLGRAIDVDVRGRWVVSVVLSTGGGGVVGSGVVSAGGGSGAAVVAVD
jgi:hypothetical protein